MEYYVYEYYIVGTNEVFYVGKGKGNRYKTTKRNNKFFNDMYNSHNCNVRKVYEGLDEKTSFQKEVELIRYYRENTTYRLTNQTDGGEGVSGLKMTKEQSEAYGNMMRDKWKEQDFRDNQMWHRNHGIYQTKEFREKVSKVTRGSNNGNYKNYWSQEMKDNLSRKRVVNGKSKGVKNSRATKIICVETNVHYDLISDAMSEYGISNASIMTVALNNMQKTAMGYHWIYANKENEHIYKDNVSMKEYLAKCLLANKSSKPLICENTKELFPSKSALSKAIDTTTSAISYSLSKYGEFHNKGLKYCYLDEHSRLH